MPERTRRSRDCAEWSA